MVHTARSSCEWSLTSRGIRFQQCFASTLRSACRGAGEWRGGRRTGRRASRRAADARSAVQSVGHEEGGAEIGAEDGGALGSLAGQEGAASGALGTAWSASADPKRGPLPQARASPSAADVGHRWRPRGRGRRTCSSASSSWSTKAPNWPLRRATRTRSATASDCIDAGVAKGGARRAAGRSKRVPPRGAGPGTKYSRGFKWGTGRGRRPVCECRARSDAAAAANRGVCARCARLRGRRAERGPGRGGPGPRVCQHLPERLQRPRAVLRVRV